MNCLRALEVLVPLVQETIRVHRLFWKLMNSSLPENINRPEAWSNGLPTGSMALLAMSSWLISSSFSRSEQCEVKGESD